MMEVGSGDPDAGAGDVSRLPESPPSVVDEIHAALALPKQGAGVRGAATGTSICSAVPQVRQGHWGQYAPCPPTPGGSSTPPLSAARTPAPADDPSDRPTCLLTDPSSGCCDPRNARPPASDRSASRPPRSAESNTEHNCNPLN